MARFSLAEDAVALPKGAWAAAYRRTLRRDGKPVLALTQGRHRAYVFPLYTPAGHAVTSESPGDHPHHNSLWIAADHVHCRMPVAGGFEEYTYNFYLDETFQGRAPGRIMETSWSGEAEGENAFRVVQTLDWRGPPEWAAPEGRLAARETRALRIAADAGSYVIRVESRLAAIDWDFTLGPTRHAYFNVRVADSMTAAFGGVAQDDRGRRGGEAVSGVGARWVDFSGPVGGGAVAGITVIPDARDHRELSWYVADWGVITVGPFRLEGRLVRQGEEMLARYRVLVHDGDAAAVNVAAHLDE